MDELGDAEQMKVEELMWNHQQRLLNRPTSEQTVRFHKFYFFIKPEKSGGIKLIIFQFLENGEHLEESLECRGFSF